MSDDILIRAEIEAAARDLEAAIASGRNQGTKNGLLQRMTEIKEAESFPYTVHEHEVEMRVKGVLVKEKILLVETDDHEYALYLED